MKSSGVTSRPRKRSYESPLREKQAEATRALIVDGLLEQLAHGGLRDFSIPQVAERAGVTTRTVYRYFPTREALLAAVADKMDLLIGSGTETTDIDEMVGFIPEQFALFSKHETLVRALLQAGVGDEVRARGRRRRAEHLRVALGKELPALRPDELRRASAIVHYLFSAAAWDALRRVWGLSEDEASATVSWAIGTLISDLRKRGKAAERSKR